LLRVELNDPDNTDRKYQYRLRMNELLYGFTNSSATGKPLYRQLTPHPSTGLGSTQLSTLYTTASPPTFPPTDAYSQEWWARYDRQIMARDIYVLLYTLGGPNDAVDYSSTTNSGFTLYSQAQLAQMAQFAVNFVDALDRDNVMTRFEYDIDLSNGWSVDDDAFTATEAPSERGEVYGIEAQQLTLSEWLGINVPMLTTDHAATRFNDMTTPSSGRFYAFLELRNAGPSTVDISNGTWQIYKTGTTGDCWLTLKDGVFNSGNGIQPGGQYVIGTSDNTEAGGFSADFRVDYDGNGSPSFDLIAPRRAQDLNNNPTDASQPTNCDLDLVYPNQITRFALRDAPNGVASGTNVPVGGFLNSGLPGVDSVTVKLRRRVNPYRAAPQSASEELDNPFVEVDQMQVGTNAIRQFNIAVGDSSATLQSGVDKLPNLASYERGEALNRATEQLHVNVGIQPNTIGYTLGVGTTQVQKNSNSPSAYTLWQPHFDRDFASVYDLLSVPLFSPSELTKYLIDGGLTPSTAVQPSGAVGTVAHHKFLRPGDPNPANANLMTDNRWYRLLEFLTVPSRTHLGVDSQLPGPRTPGALNLNTLRHRGVLAAGIDDPDNPNTGPIEGHFNPSYAADANGVGLNMLIDQFEGANRDWWVQFLRSRDGIDPVTGLLLPGLPHSQPFRSLAYADAQNLSLESTLLRRLPMDSGLGWSQQRQMFEARTAADTSSTPTVDYHTRHRLLRKLGNNSTTRSNVFIVYVSVEYFEAIGGGTSGNPVQIGAKLAGTTGHKGFFIVDRSLPEQAYNPASQGNPSTPTFDWRKFVQYWKVIQ
jgi:hypothetical protein